MHKHTVLHRFLIFSLITLLLFSPVLVAHADLAAQEIALATNGQPWEANLDSQGMLWVSHLIPAEIWRVNTQSGAITVYPVGGEPSDGRGDGAGAVWWADLGSNNLKRLNTSNNQVTVWQVPGSTGLYTTAIDSQGRVWVMDFSQAKLYRLDPASNQLCTYPLPDGGLANYLDVDGQAVWYGDYVNERIVRLDPVGGSFEWWLLPASSYPLDVVLDGGGSPWYTDTSLNRLGRLESATNHLTLYTLPGDLDPQMLSLNDDQVWFSFQDPGNPGGVGRLDPASASGAGSTVSSGNQAVTPSCTSLSPSTSSLTPSSKQASWNSQNYPVLHSQGGWLTFRSPENGLPFGIATGEYAWLVDQGRGKLARLSYPAQVSACARVDADGDLGTTNDQTPKSGWTVYLTTGGVRQLPAKATGPDGCATWYGLQPGLVYGVSQDLPPGWLALTPSDHDFGTVAPDQAYNHTFINQQSSALLFMPLALRKAGQDSSN